MPLSGPAERQRSAADGTLLRRTLTAAVLLGGCLAALFLLERVWLAVLASLVAALAAAEWMRLGPQTRLPAPLAGAIAGVSCGVALALFWPLHPPRRELLAVWASASLFWAVAAPALLARGLPATRAFAHFVAGVFLIAAPVLALVALAPERALALLALCWISDSAAYLAGRRFGRRPLAPAISPGKTLEGAAAGFATVLVCAMIAAQVLPGLARPASLTGWVAFLALVAALVALGIVADLFKSLLKRRAGVKDSGRLLPGHGGVLDRVDSSLAVLPAGALAFSLFSR